MIASISNPKFGIYIHWPFCASKCPYCDFNSHVRESIDVSRWKQAYLKELESTAEKFGKRFVDTIFFGGGTPSLMETFLVSDILEYIEFKFGISPDTEITLEANPSSAEASKFRSIHGAGVNRLSLGIQSFDDRSLNFLGRAHSAQEGRVALNSAIDIFPRVSLDLIYALPDQTHLAWRNELSEALSFGAEHISAYQLTLEKGTPFFHAAKQGKLVLPDENTSTAHYEVTQELCDKAGMSAYEISNHCFPGQESRHNLLYWRSRDWIGVGPGAHGRINTSSGRISTQQIQSPESWLNAVESGKSGKFLEEYLDKNSVCEEALLMGLRLTEGIQDEWFHELTGHDIESTFAPSLFELTTLGLLDWNGRRLCTTDSGRLVLEEVVRKLALLVEV